ncbi:MAG: electron transfer flavoprotein subunit beta/FixA family protein [Pseudomonadota bacterium]
MQSGLDGHVMTLLVLVKQVPIPEEPSGMEMNRFDEYAVEEALRIRELFPGVQVHVMTLGPEGAGKVVKRALGMGADAGIHVITPENEFPGSALTAARAAAAINNHAYDLILTGILSQDRMEGQVGPLMAEYLGIPCAVGVVETALDPEDGSIRVEREMEAGFRDCISMRLPAVLAVQAGINRPRYPSLSHVLAAGKKTVHLVRASDLPGAPFAETQHILDLIPPEKTRAGVFVNGTCRDKAEELLHVLQQRGVI